MHNGASVADKAFQLLSDFFARYGYSVVFFGVMLENSGLPVPGETVLLFSGFLAYHGRLSLGRAIFTAIAGATLAVFVARFITGLRVIAGPLAGAFLMPYPRFLLANFSGAVVWAFTIGWAGYLFGSNWQRLVHLFKQVDTAILVAVAVVVLIVWVVYRRKSSGQKVSR